SPAICWCSCRCRARWKASMSRWRRVSACSRPGASGARRLAGRGQGESGMAPWPADATSNLNLPNALSVLRLLLAPWLLWCAHAGWHDAFLGWLALTLFTDLLDGHLARRWGQATELGVKLDSWGDLTTYAVMVLGLMWLWPERFAREAWFVYLAIGFYLIPVITNLLKFRELPR